MMFLLQVFPSCLYRWTYHSLIFTLSLDEDLFADGNDFSWKTIEKNRNVYYQKQTADQIRQQTTQTMSLLSAALKIHLNIGQNQHIFMSFQTISSRSLSEKRRIEGVDNLRLDLPSNSNSTITDDQPMSLRLIVQPLASSDSSSVSSLTNLSRSVSFSLLDVDGNERSLSTTSIDHPYRLIIPRDPSFILPPMTLQNVTSFNVTPHHHLFHFQSISILHNNTSIHIEIKPLNKSVAYFFIARFDHSPHIDHLITNNDNASVFCPSDLVDDGDGEIYKCFFDNRETRDHRWLIFGLREVNMTEVGTYCSNGVKNESWPRFDERYEFRWNYEVRVYTSGCYYLDENNEWKSDGMVVGAGTNHNETECFSTFV